MAGLFNLSAYYNEHVRFVARDRQWLNMIQNDREYQAAVRRLEAQHVWLVEHAGVWIEQGWGAIQTAKLLEPEILKYTKLVKQVQVYEQFVLGVVLTVNQL